MVKATTRQAFTSSTGWIAWSAGWKSVLILSAPRGTLSCATLATLSLTISRRERPDAPGPPQHPVAESILEWPVFKRLGLLLEGQSLALVHQDNCDPQASPGVDDTAPLAEAASSCPGTHPDGQVIRHAVQNFLRNVHSKNPTLEPQMLGDAANRCAERGFDTSVESALVVGTPPAQKPTPWLNLEKGHHMRPRPRFIAVLLVEPGRHWQLEAAGHNAPCPTLCSEGKTGSVPTTSVAHGNPVLLLLWCIRYVLHPSGFCLAAF